MIALTKLERALARCERAIAIQSARKATIDKDCKRPWLTQREINEERAYQHERARRVLSFLGCRQGRITRLIRHAKEVEEVRAYERELDARE